MTITTAAVKVNRQYFPWLVSLAVIAAAAFALFGFAGFRTIIAVVILFIIPPLISWSRSIFGFWILWER